jgi:NitT/TauT family transport system substrate-binding protein
VKRKRAKSIRRHALAIALALAAMLVPPGAPAAETVTVSLTRSTASAPVFIAAARGYFAGHGLDARFLYFTAALPVATAIVSRDADFGVTGLSAGLYNLAGKGALKIIAGSGQEVKGGFLTPYLASNAAYDKGLHSPRDFAGKTVGLTTFGGPFHYDVIQLATKYGFALASMRLLQLQSFNNIAAALKGGTIDAGLLTSVAAQPIAERGEGRIIGWVGDETPWQLSAVFTSAATDANRRDLVTHFLAAYREATRDYDAAFQQRDADGRIVPGKGAPALIKIISDATQLPEAATRKSLGFIDRNGGLMPGNIAAQIATWKRLGMVNAEVEAGGIIDASLAAPGAR